MDKELVHVLMYVDGENGVVVRDRMWCVHPMRYKVKTVVLVAKLESELAIISVNGEAGESAKA